MEARMADALPITLTIIGLLLIVALSGLLLKTKQLHDVHLPTSLWILLGLVLLLTLAQYVYYNLTFVQFQGRYLFTGLIPFALVIVLGVDNWQQLILGRFDLLKWVTSGIFLLFVPLDFYLIWRVIPGAVSRLG
jgi:hypothetical protein